MSKRLTFILFCLLTGCAFISEPDVGPGPNYSEPDWPEDGNSGGAPAALNCEDDPSRACEPDVEGTTGNQPDSGVPRCPTDANVTEADEMGMSPEDESANCEEPTEESDGTADAHLADSTEVGDGAIPHLPEDIEVQETDETEETEDDDV